MSARGYGYGGYGGYSPRARPEYYGPTGEGIVDAFAARDAANRQSGIDKGNAEEQQVRIAGERQRQKQISDLTPLEEAIMRAHARDQGILGPGEHGEESPSGQGLPPASDVGIMGQRGGVGGASGNPPMRGNTTQGQPANPMYDTSRVAGTAHALPGAFNPVTGQHNPADVDLGGGYHLAGSMTREGRHARALQELSGAHIPGMTPELASYLADHPEHIGPMLDAQFRRGAGGGRYEPSTQAEWMQNERFLSSLPRRGQDEKPEMSLEHALAQVDEMYGSRDPVTGAISSRLNPGARMRLGEEVSHGNFSRLGGSTKRFGTAPVDFGQGGAGAKSKRHITTDQRDYLKAHGKWDESRYIVDED